MTKKPPSFKLYPIVANPRTGILVILDGFGHQSDPHFNAIASARTPTWDGLMAKYPHGLIQASESFVGLPGGFMGNSEVGHLNIGAGRVVRQDFSLISSAIESGEFFENSVLLGVLSKVKMDRKSKLHVIALISDGGVHSHISHVKALLQLAKQQGVSPVCLHAILDGRDTSPTSGKKFLGQLISYCEEIGVGEIKTVMGRFYAMDRDKRWERTAQAYDAIVAGEAAASFKDPVGFVEKNYQDQITDEFVIPGIREGYTGIHDGDAVLFFNFRADRARQLTYALTQMEFPHFRRKKLPALSAFATLTPYDPSLGIASAYDKPEVPKTLGEVVSDQGWKQLRIAETEKYAHVTYFFNGGKETLFEGEERILVPSPKNVRTYDEKPEMSAEEVTDKLLASLEGGEFRFAVVNFANPDMVGHTGNFPAAIKAVEVVDQCLGRIVKWVEANDAFAVITADHGNCESMRDPQGMPLTAHTLNAVPFIVVDPEQKKSAQIRSGGSLCDVAPTLLSLWEIRPPREMTGKSLLIH